MRAPDMPEGVVQAALAAYAQHRWRGADIGNPATVFMLDNEVHETAFNAALAVAYRSGIEAALPRVEWRVTTCGPAGKTRIDRSIWSSCETRERARHDLATAVWEGWLEPWIEHRRVGATDWERVP